MISVKYSIYSDEGLLLYSQEIKKHGSAALFLNKDEEEYPILSEITAFDIEVFFSEEMNDLIEELNYLKKSLKDKSDIVYLEEIIRLCQKCQDNNVGEIKFNPFTNLVKIGNNN